MPGRGAESRRCVEVSALRYNCRKLARPMRPMRRVLFGQRKASGICRPRNSEPLETMSENTTPEKTADGGLPSTDLLAFFPSAHSVEIRWQVDLPDDCDTETIEDDLFALEGVDEISGGNPACSPHVIFSLPPDMATPERLGKLGKDFAAILEANDQADS